MSDRKYRHRGYMDDDDRREREPRPRATEERGRPRLEGAPRGRGVGLPTAVVFKCSLCGKEQETTSVAPDDRCASCGKPLHTCTNCSFFDTSARFECRKPIATRVESKTKANQCEHYQPKAVRDLRAAAPEKTRDARAAFDALFKK